MKPIGCSNEPDCADCPVASRVIAFLVKEAKTNKKLLKDLMKLGKGKNTWGR